MDESMKDGSMRKEKGDEFAGRKSVLKSSQ
jgi:hypothetical protein